MNNRAAGLRCCGQMVLVVFVAIGLTVSKKALADNNILVMDWESISGNVYINRYAAVAAMAALRVEGANEGPEWFEQYKVAKPKPIEQLHDLIGSPDVTSTDLPVFVVTCFPIARCDPSVLDPNQFWARQDVETNKSYIADTFGVNARNVEDAEDIAVVLGVVDPFNKNKHWPLPGQLIRKDTELLEEFRGSVRRDIFVVSTVDFGCGDFGYQCLRARVIELALLRLEKLQASQMSWKAYLFNFPAICGFAAVAPPTADNMTYIRTMGILIRSLLGQSDGEILFGVSRTQKLTLSEVHELLGRELDFRRGKVEDNNSTRRGADAFEQTTFSKRKDNVYMEPFIFVPRDIYSKGGDTAGRANGYPFPVYVHNSRKGRR
eukprot:GHVS01067093.1.p1 GENE.GHVS01067093.1~~GHVS01067093.1.p1  ORF type:complete len:377 (+),score=52.71 GHVS01067093.1:183-1313(+)